MTSYVLGGYINGRSRTAYGNPFHSSGIVAGMIRRWITLMTVGAAVAFCAEPDAKDQTAIQAALTRYFRAVNTCNRSAAQLETIAGYEPPFDLLPPGLLSKFSGKACTEGKNRYEFAISARFVAMLDRNTATADGSFRTIHFTPEKAGRVFAVFLRQGDTWKIANIRLAPTPFEPPNYAVPVAASHEPAGADGWSTVDASRVVDLTGTPVSSAWEVDGATFHSVRAKTNRDIRTKDSYTNFELRFEWKVSAAANSGVKYRLFSFFADPERGSRSAGYEYQIVDNEGDPGARQHAVERAGSLYNQIAAIEVPRRVGEWNEGVVIVKGTHLEHWLNDKKVLEFETESDQPEGPIVFQHHGGGAWLRKIRIRRLD